MNRLSLRTPQGSRFAPLWVVLTSPLIKRHFQAWMTLPRIDTFGYVDPRRNRLELARKPLLPSIDGPEALRMELRKRFDAMVSASPKPVSVVDAASL
jgi:hypothetical protein